MNRTGIFILFLALLAALLGYNYFFQPFKDLERPSPVTWEPTSVPTPTPLTTTDLLFDSLTPHDRVAQLLAVPLTLPLDVSTESAEVEWIQSHRPGFVTLFGRQVASEEAAATIAELRDEYSATLSAMIMVDHEGGTVQRLNGDGFTVLPSWRSLCEQDAETSAELLRSSAVELKNVGIDLVFAPVVDVGSATTPLTSRICSDDPAHVSERADEWVRVFQQVGITPVLKHFPGIGTATRDLHFAFDRVTITANDTQPYLDILDTNPAIGVSVTHVGVTNQDPDLPCSLSESCVGQLRTNFPEVLIFTDSLTMSSAEYQSGTTEPKPLVDRAKEAVLAGNNVLVFGEGVDAVTLSTLITELETAYDQSLTFRAQVDRSVKKIIDFKVSQR